MAAGISSNRFGALADCSSGEHDDVERERSFMSVKAVCTFADVVSKRGTDRWLPQSSLQRRASEASRHLLQRNQFDPR